MTNRLLVLSILATLIGVAVACDPHHSTNSNHDSIDAQSEPTLEEEVRITMQARLDQKEAQQNELQGITAGHSGPDWYISGIGHHAPPGTIALTFDDGPRPDEILPDGRRRRFTSKVLDILKKYGIHATFFMEGIHSGSNQALVNRVIAEGHHVGNHSYNHPNFHTLRFASDEAKDISSQEFQILGGEGPILQAMGKEKFFRYPYGNSTTESNKMLLDRGYGIVGWHLDSCDWAFEAGHGSVTPKQMENICGGSQANLHSYINHVVETMKSKLYGGGIILMHDVHGLTVDSLEELIIKLQQSGFRFTTLDDPAYAPFIFRGRK